MLRSKSSTTLINSTTSLYSVSSGVPKENYSYSNCVWISSSFSSSSPKKSKVLCCSRHSATAFVFILFMFLQITSGLQQILHRQFSLVKRSAMIINHNLQGNSRLGSSSSAAVPCSVVPKLISSSTHASSSTLLLQFDGGSRGNPGVAGAGAVLYEVIPQSDPSKPFEIKKEIWATSIYIGTATNNVAEYTGLVEGLRYCQARMRSEKLVIQGDSQLVIRQLMKIYKVKNENLKVLYTTATEFLTTIPNREFVHIPRELNKRADELANLAMDSMQSKSWEHE